MNPFDNLLGFVAVVCSGCGAFVLARSGYQPLWKWMIDWTQKDVGKYQAWVDELFLGWSAERARNLALTSRIAILAAAFATYVLSGSIVFAAFAAALCYVIPILLYRQAHDRRLRRLDSQIPDAVTVMLGSARAGNSLPQAVADVYDKMPAPIRDEFGVIAREVAGGLAIEEALARARRRVDIEHFTMVTGALIVNKIYGGDLPHILERMADSTRELLRLQKKIETETSEVRAQQKIILLMTPLFGGMACLFDSSVYDILFHSIPGNIILVVVVAVQAICYFWIQRIIHTTI